MRYSWTEKKPNSVIRQISKRGSTILRRKPFNGEWCEYIELLLEDGSIWTHYFNDKHALWKQWIFD
ncbi:MAG: hypothetical protein IJ143_09785 [Neisseriaceae bacterium]|nr:hypothetical protein [Neisseriaceae bacterium]